MALSPRWLALLLVACADTPVAKTAAHTEAPNVMHASAAVATRPHHKPIAFTPPEPALGIATPMRGEADPKTARLVATTCDEITTTETDAAVRAMRAAV